MEISNAAYVKFPDFEHRANWHLTGDTLTDYRKFLELHGGPENEAWSWSRGDRFAQGVYIKEAAVAIMFKLKFDL